MSASAAPLLGRRAATKRPTPRVGAIVVGGDYQGLGIVRSLGRRGVPIVVVDDERSIARFSRYATRAVKVPDLRDEWQTVQTLLAIGRTYGLDGWLLFPTRDETVVALARYRALLGEWFRVWTPPFETVRWAWDKRNTHQLAAQLGIPAPRTWYPSDEHDLEAIEAEPPFAIKPAIKEHFVYATRAKAWRASSRDELCERFRQATALVGPGEVMIQELIPGDGHQQVAYCGFISKGQVLGSMVVRRLRQHPPEFGRASTYVETIEEPTVEALSERFLRAIDYYGLVELEYKQDPRSGEYKLLDVNARTWGYHSLGASAGVDFPWLLYADQLGQTVQPVRARPGVRWARLVTDLPTAAVELARGNLNPVAYARSLLECDTESVFDIRDPLPALAELALTPYLAVKRGF